MTKTEATARLAALRKMARDGDPAYSADEHTAVTNILKGKGR